MVILLISKERSNLLLFNLNLPLKFNECLAHEEKQSPESINLWSTAFKAIYIQYTLEFI